jgi:hypothetical protein
MTSKNVRSIKTEFMLPEELCSPHQPRAMKKPKQVWVRVLPWEGFTTTTISKEPHTISGCHLKRSKQLP